MKTLQSPENAASSLVREKLVNPAIRKMFEQKSREGKISVILVHLIGAETDRFAAAPIYATTGKGYLKSKGIDGLREEEELENYLRGNEGRQYVDEILHLIKSRLATRYMNNSAPISFAKKRMRPRI